MLASFAYRRPATLEDAVEALGRPGSRAHAGGTDLLGCLRDGVFGADTVVSLAGLDGLRGVAESREGLRIGALTPIAEVARHPLVRERLTALADAAASVGSPQLRNQGTLGGNLCQKPRCWYYRGGFDCLRKGGDVCYAVDGENAYHAILGGGPCYIVHPSDTAPALMALGAVARVVGPSGVRLVPLDRFFVLPEHDPQRETVLDGGELLAELVLPAPPAGRRSSYRKVRTRAAWDFALAGVAIALDLDGGAVRAARLVLSGVAPAPWRAAAAEAALTGARLTPAIIRRAAEAAVAGAEPLEANAYKVAMVRGLVMQQLERMAAG